ncbi:DUF547 domain-containing protein [Vibrio metschnikovii]|uniref:DUF547 domain-containing protein n=1 Tax=Vibrio metschnikovii TaxID=28172 RepID=UPI001C308C9B|nr:DUF547 domain-containing protein [Vibrio metschnikovii]
MKFLLSLLSLFWSLSISAAPKSELWDFWNQSNEANTQEVSHQAWQQLLDRYLSQQGMHTLFDYANVEISDREKLQTYINQLARLDPRILNKQQQYAYWINLYNALTVNIILEHYPVSSITKIGGWFRFGPWNLPLLEIANQKLTLNDIEHRILRPIWQDARIHYVVNCASLGCPNLKPEAFTADNIERLLEQAAYEFINSDKGVNIHNRRLILSSIYQWYAEDFGSQDELLDHLIRYRPALANDERIKRSFRYEYDWQLNRK